VAFSSGRRGGSHGSLSGISRAGEVGVAGVAGVGQHGADRVVRTSGHDGDGGGDAVLQVAVAQPGPVEPEPFPELDDLELT
jgi:hypothetical protein